MHEFGHTGGVTAANFSPDGAQAVTACEDQTARIWEVRAHQAIDGALANELARFCSGAELDPRLGVLRQLSIAERLAIWQKLEPGLGGSAQWLAVARTFLAEGADAPAGFTSTMTVRDAASRLMQTGGDGCIHEALAVGPGNPLIQIALAGLKDYAEQAEFLREYGG